MVFVFTFMTSVVVAQAIITIDSRNPVYGGGNNVVGTNHTTEAEVRTAAVSELASRYRAVHGVLKLPNGTQYKVIYPNGSSEMAVVVNRFSTLGSLPTPGTGSSSPSAGCDTLVICNQTGPGRYN